MQQPISRRRQQEIEQALEWVKTRAEKRSEHSSGADQLAGSQEEVEAVLQWREANGSDASKRRAKRIREVLNARIAAEAGDVNANMIDLVQTALNSNESDEAVYEKLKFGVTDRIRFASLESRSKEWWAVCPSRNRKCLLMRRLFDG